MHAERFLRMAAAFSLVALGTGCAGARTSIVADDAQYPISLSRAVRDTDGQIVASERATVVGQLHFSSTAWGLLYSAIKLTPETDISKAVNEQMAASGGDAVVNLHVKSGHCASDFFAVFTFIPIWPGCANVEVDGDIIKVRRSNAPVDTSRSASVDTRSLLVPATPAAPASATSPNRREASR